MDPDKIAETLIKLKDMNESGYVKNWFDTIKNSLVKTNRVTLNKFYTYIYKATTNIDFYDTIPLIICIDVDKDGFIGLNFHHILHFKDRKNSITKLLEHYHQNKKISYVNTIFGKQIIRKYLYKGIISNNIWEVDMNSLIDGISKKVNTIIENK